MRFMMNSRRGRMLQLNECVHDISRAIEDEGEIDDDSLVYGHLLRAATSLETVVALMRAEVDASSQKNEPSR